VIAWLRTYGWIVLFVLGAVAALVLTGGKARWPVAKEIDATKKAAEAEAKAAKLEAQIGHAEAVKKIEEDYRATIDTLEERQKKEAVELRKNPRKLSRFLARAASSKPSGTV
jgi:vacuolar-type H+-ATPase subunit H